MFGGRRRSDHDVFMTGRTSELSANKQSKESFDEDFMISSSRNSYLKFGSNDLPANAFSGKQTSARHYYDQSPDSQYYDVSQTREIIKDYLDSDQS